VSALPPPHLPPIPEWQILAAYVFHTLSGPRALTSLAEPGSFLLTLYYYFPTQYTVLPWRFWYWVPLKPDYDITIQNAAFFIITTVQNFNLTKQNETYFTACDHPAGSRACQGISAHPSTLIKVLSTNRLFAKYMHSWYTNGYEMHRVFTRDNNCIWANEIRQ
jgi:hypothetical protein